MRRRLPLLLTALLLLTGPAAAQVDGFGHRVSSDEDTERYEIDTNGPRYVLVVDENNNDYPSTGESVFLSASNSQVTAGAVRLANPETGQVGSTVQTGDPLHGVSATEVTGQLTFRDIDGDGDLERGEPIYWEADELSTSELHAGDLQIGGDGAGTIVSAGDRQVGRTTTDLDGQFGYVDGNNNRAYNAGDRVFLDLYRDGYASVPDLALTREGNNFGTMLEAGEEEITHRLHNGQAPDQFIFIDGDGDGDLDREDPVFLADATSRVFGDAIRLANEGEAELGSYVGADPQGQLGTTATELSGTLSFVDTDNDGNLDENEVLIYDRNTGSTNTADGNDIILSGPDAGTHVADSATYRSNNLDSAPGTIRFLDQDASNSFTLGDLIYLDADGDQFVSGADVQLTNHTAPTSDTDGDGIIDGQDNCPDTANADQADADDDGTGDACDDDRDGDGVANSEDNCPDTANPDQADEDGDGEGDACDTSQPEPDVDDDGVPDSEDNCPNTANSGQTDTDHDGKGDVCDDTPHGQPQTDGDGDGVVDGEDNCPMTKNADQTDTDGDGTGDACDGDIDGDGLTNVRERGLGTNPEVADTDGDGVRDDKDNCPTTENADQADEDGDGTGDACEGETGEGDGVPAPGAVIALIVTALTAIVARARDR